MLRKLYEKNDMKGALATFKAGAAMTTGMGVVKDETTGEAKLPTAETASEIFFVDKDRQPSGAKAALSNFSDYDEMFTAIASGEKVLLVHADETDKFGTDAYKAADMIAANVGKYVAVGTDGKWCVAASATTSHYVFRDTYDDAGHTLAIIERIETAGKNS